VLDVHGEDQSIWPANDALCAALQIINHLQDCGADYCNLDRVYVPLDARGKRGTVADLGKDASSPALRQALRSLAVRTGHLLDKCAIFRPYRRFSLATSVRHPDTGAPPHRNAHYAIR
jgi:phytoene/squalene synthetase